ncbi:hypothetical protein BdWA1_003028 [Babesia duncani]|uniref:RAP domain-containing protein n=1 Tax=Babesia duncani TaxID=323732 RepID=A0AAD9PI96_9APIC|nr:hypothetical protein BdWA1_003028 [Babesia duncani]
MYALKGTLQDAIYFYKVLTRNAHTFEIIRIPLPDKSKNSITNIHKGLIEAEELQNIHREGLMTVYRIISDSDIRNKLNSSYFDALQKRTCSISLSLIPRDYAKIFLALREFPNISFDCVRCLNDNVQNINSNFNAREIALILKAYASIGSRSLKTITGLIGTFIKKFDDADLWNIREIACALAKLNVAPKTNDVIANFYKKSVSILPKHMKTLDINEIGVFVNSFAKHGVPQDEVLHFVDMHTKKITDATPKTLALLSNAFAKNNKSSKRFLNSVSDMLNQILEDIYNGKDNCLNVVDLAITFNAFTKLDHFDNKLYDKAIPFLLTKIGSDTSILSLVLLAHAYSHANIKGHDLYSKIAYVCIQRLDKFNYKQLGIIALAFAKVKYNPEVFFLRLADEIIYRGTVGLKQSRYEFDLQSLEQLMQAFGRINFKDDRLYCVFTTLLRERLKKNRDDSITGDMIASLMTSMCHKHGENFVPFITHLLISNQDATVYSTIAISRVVKAMNELQVKHPEILGYFVQETRKRINQFPPNVLITTFKALAKMKGFDSVMVKETLKRLSLYLAQFSTFDISNVLTGLCDFGYRSVSFIKKLSIIINHQMNNFSKQQLHIIFTRLAMLRASDADLYNKLIQKIMSKQREFNEVELAEICISYIYILMHFDYLKRDFEMQMTGTVFENKLLSVNSILINSTLIHLKKNLDVATIFKLQGVYLYLKLICPEMLSGLSAASIQLLEKCSKIKFNLAEYFLTSSSSHREVSHYLNLLGIIHKNEVPCPPYIIDIVPLLKSGTKYAIEYDGPSHFYMETTMRTAKSILKHEEWAQLGNNDNYHSLFYRVQLLSGNMSNFTESWKSQIRAFSTVRKLKRLHRMNEDILQEQLKATQDEFQKVTTSSVRKSEEDKLLKNIYNSELEGSTKVLL